MMTAALTAEYAMWDAWITLCLYMALKPKLISENLGAVWQHKMEMIRLLISMEGNGVLVDQELCTIMAERGHEEMDGIKEELKINPGSTKDLEKLIVGDLGLPVVKRTPKGQPCFDKFAMAEYDIMLERINDRRAKNILAYRGWQKSTSSNYEPYVRLLSPDLRLRPNYNLHRTVTGRMSCKLPNLQQIPRTTDKPWNGRMKHCFIAPPGYVLLEGDYSQLEFRLSSAFAKQQNLLDIFNDPDPDADIFRAMATELGMERYEAKTLAYVISYGGGAGQISTRFGVDVSTGQRYRDDFFRAYPNLLRASNLAANHAKARRKVPLWTGRYRHFLNVKEDAHKAFNSLVQGGAADIVERTMTRLDRDGFNTPECSMLLQVHDSVVFQVLEEKVDYYKPLIADCMSAVDPNFGVRFKVDLHEWGLAA
jgi:DNA polymerase-1